MSAGRHRHRKTTWWVGGNGALAGFMVRPQTVQRSASTASLHSFSLLTAH